MWFVAYVASCLGFALTRTSWQIVSVLMVFAIAGSARRLAAAVRARLSEGTRAAWRAAGAVVGATALLAVLWWVLDVEGLGFAAGALGFLCVGLVLELARTSDAVLTRWSVWVLVVCVAVGVAGAVALAVTGESWALVVTAVGVLAAPVGISLVSGRVLRTPPRGRQTLVVALVGLAVVALSLALMVALGADPGYVAAFGGAVVVLVGAMASRSVADVVVVIALTALVWTLGQRTVADPEPPAADAPVVVAVGDSYISGEGAEVYYRSTDDGEGRDCHRAPTAYPVLLTLEERPDLPDEIDVVACTGATTSSLERHQLPELGGPLGGGADDLVLVSIGGNDALFGTVGQVCLLPGDCAEMEGAWTAHLAEVEADLVTTYEAVAAAVTPTTEDGDPPRLWVVPYPVPIDDGVRSCPTSVLSRSERRAIVRFTTALNETVARAAGAAGFEVVDTMPDALVGRRLCDDVDGVPGVNFVDATSVAGTLEQSVNPVNWFHTSLHPNETGHELMRGALLAWMDDTVEPAAEATAADEEPPPDDGRCAGEEAAALEDCSWQWAREQLGRFLLTKGLVGVATVVGAWVLSVAAIGWWRRVMPSDRLTPSGP